MDPPPLLVLCASAIWCPACRTLAPHFEEAAAAVKEVSFVKFDVDDDVVVAENLGIEVMPSMLFLVDGEVKHRLEGAFPAADIVRSCEEIFEISSEGGAVGLLSDEDLGGSICT